MRRVPFWQDHAYLFIKSYLCDLYTDIMLFLYIDISDIDKAYSGLNVSIIPLRT